MRLKYALFVLLFTSPFIVAQEEPLPVVIARATAAPEVMLIATAVEPVREYHTPTLAEAARLNDYNTFDTLYRKSPDARFATLHELWTYAMTNPIGSFYGEEMYERMARAYPGYAEFIDQHRIVDSRGNVFYPTSETRAFVLERAMEGRAPRVMVAEDPKPAPVVATVQPAAGLRARPSRKTDEAPSSLERRALSPSAPVVVAETPAVAPVVETAPAAEAAAAPPVAVQPAPAPVAAAQPEPTSSRGILLIVIGLLGVGLLAVMFRTPQDTTLPPIINVKPEEKPAAPVEPLRRPEGPQPAPKNRATGSHG